MQTSRALPRTVEGVCIQIAGGRDERDDLGTAWSRPNGAGARGRRARWFASKRGADHATAALRTGWTRSRGRCADAGRGRPWLESGHRKPRRADPDARPLGPGPRSLRRGERRCGPIIAKPIRRVWRSHRTRRLRLDPAGLALGFPNRVGGRVRALRRRRVRGDVRQGERRGRRPRRSCRAGDTRKGPG